MRLDFYNVGTAGRFGADYRFISTFFGGLPAACLALAVTGIFLFFSFGEISRTVAQFGLQLAANAVLASALIIPISYMLLYLPLRISSLFALLYAAVGMLSAPLLLISGFWPVNIFSTLSFFEPSQVAYLSAWTITTLTYWLALPIFLVIGRFGAKSLLSSHRTHITIRTPLPTPWRPLSVLRYIFGVHAAYGWNWTLTLARAFFAAGFACLFYSLYGSASKLGVLTEPCYLDEAGRTIGVSLVRENYLECIHGIENLMERSLTVLLNAGMGVLVGIGGIYGGRQLYSGFLEERHNAYSEYHGDVLFLRPFNEDARTFRDNKTPSRWAFFDLVDQAENFARLLDQTLSEFGRTVAVRSPKGGNTGGQLVTEMSLPMESWQESVKNMAAEADAIVFVDGKSEGVAWERGMLLDAPFTDKTLFLVGAEADWRSIQQIVEHLGIADPLLLRRIGRLSRRHVPIGIHLRADIVRLYYSKAFQMSAYHSAILDFCNNSGLRAGTRHRTVSSRVVSATEDKGAAA